MYYFKSSEYSASKCVFCLVVFWFCFVSVSANDLFFSIFSFVNVNDCYGTTK